MIGSAPRFWDHVPYCIRNLEIIYPFIVFSYSVPYCIRNLENVVVLELLLPVCSILHTQFRDFKAKVFKIRLGSILHTQFRDNVFPAFPASVCSILHTQFILTRVQTWVFLFIGFRSRLYASNRRIVGGK